MTRFFDPDRPRVLAHRGLAIDAPENTPLAFMRAIEAGAVYIETDVNASSDGIAIVSHDADLTRIAGRDERVGALSAAELSRIDLGQGQGLVPLAEVLDGFPETRFNIDVKDPRAVEPTAAAILRTNAIERVLITSFSGARRRATVQRLPGVATSASALPFLVSLLAGKVGFSPGVKRALRGLDAVQIPERALGLSSVTRRAIRGFQAAGVEVHIWTVNSPARMRELFDLGVDGIVTDRADLAVRTANGDTLTENPL